MVRLFTSSYFSKFFEENLIDYLQHNKTRAGVEMSLEWMKNKVQDLKDVKPQKFVDNSVTVEKHRKTILGKMLMYFYEPKTKDKMQYYDAFPIVIPIEQYSDGWLGINLHYVEPAVRLRIMKEMLKLVSDGTDNSDTKFNADWDLVSHMSKYDLIAPCLKRYLANHVRSNLVEVNSHEWNAAVFLPVAKFMKHDQNYVWNESKKASQRFRTRKKGVS